MFKGCQSPRLVTYLLSHWYWERGMVVELVLMNKRINWATLWAQLFVEIQLTKCDTSQYKGRDYFWSSDMDTPVLIYEISLIKTCGFSSSQGDFHSFSNNSGGIWPQVFSVCFTQLVTDHCRLATIESMQDVNAVPVCPLCRSFEGDDLRGVMFFTRWFHIYYRGWERFSRVVYETWWFHTDFWFSPRKFGEMIQFDVRIFFKLAGSTTS